MHPQNIKNLTSNLRLVASEEQENYESVYGKIDDAEERRATYQEIENGGLWCVSSQYLCPCCSQWVTADSIGMIIGAPFDESNNCYIPDLIDSARSKLTDCTLDV